MTRIHKILAGTIGALSLAAMTAVAAAPQGYGPGAGCATGPGMGMGMGPGMGMGMGMGMMQGGGHGHMHGGGVGPMAGACPGMMAPDGLAAIKTRLAITAQQEAAWQAFATQATARAAQMQATHAQHRQAADAGQSAPDRMTQHLAVMSQHLTSMQSLNGAMKDLYAVLTPEQRSQADQLFGRPAGRVAGHRHMRG